MIFTGTYTAIVTPFRHGQIDEPALERLINFRVLGKARQHSDRLRALAGKDEGNHASYHRSSTEPQVKPPPTPCSRTRSPR